jgi:GT2 family glycosyltransferase
MKASLIILSYNQLDETTKPCIESIYRNTDMKDFELIVVDNNSQDETPKYLKKLSSKYDNVKIILNKENHGYARGNNDGMKLASGDFMVLLNSDILVTDGWLDSLLYPFFVDHKIGLVGPITNSSGNEQKVDLNGLDIENYDEIAKKHTTLNKKTFFEVTRLGFFCVAIKREAFEKIGYLDEVFGIGMFEDDDYTTRAIKEGFKNVMTEGCFIYHKGSVSFKREFSSGKNLELYLKNKNIFNNKHNKNWLISGVLSSYVEFISHNLGMIKKNPHSERVIIRLNGMKYFLELLKEIEILYLKLGSKKDNGFEIINKLSAENSNLEERNKILMEKIKTMETSKFWKIRDLYIKTKELLMFKFK